MLDFQNVRLSSSELSALRRLNSDFQVYVDELGEANATRLISLEFASLFQYDRPDGDSPYILELKDAGRDYLRYWDSVEEQRRVEAYRYRVATGISILAMLIALVSLLADIGLFRIIQAADPTPTATAIPAVHTSTPFYTGPTPTISPTISPTEAPLLSSSPVGSVSPGSVWFPQRESTLP